MYNIFFFYIHYLDFHRFDIIVSLTTRHRFLKIGFSMVQASLAELGAGVICINACTISYNISSNAVQWLEKMINISLNMPFQYTG